MSTPIRRQYLDLKAKFPDTLLFFRLGDFYETFDDDAKVAAAELGITLTSKPMGKDLRVPLAGVPYHSIDGHVAKLVKAGHRVAICEQMADPAEVKGLVPRDVVRVVTAGTVTADNSLDAEAPNYLASLVARRGTVGLALADVTTGEVRAGSGALALGELQRIVPAELLVEDPGEVPAGYAGVVRNVLSLSDSSVGVALATRYGEHAPDVLLANEAEKAALAQLLSYLAATYPSATGALQRVRPLTDGATLGLDSRTLRNLEVLPQPGRPNSLFQVMNRAQSPMGARLLREWLAAPLREPDALSARLAAVEWAVAHPLERERAAAVLRGMSDLGRLAGKLGSRATGPRDLHALRTGLRATFDLGAVLERCELPSALRSALEGLAAAVDHLAQLDACLHDDPAPSFDDGGVIRDGFSPEIDSLRGMARDARGYLLGLEQQERDRTGIRTLKVGHNRVFGYYLEVSSANAASVPQDYQRRQTLVGAERYVTEQLKEFEANLVGARDRLAELERQVFAQLVESLAAGLDALHRVAASVAFIDLALALGQLASERAYVRPAFNREGLLRIKGGRHPVVEAAGLDSGFVPNDCELDADCQVVILTGPNMSGKSTFLRQVALIALMAQAGSFVPAESATLPLFDRLFTRIGAQDDLAAGQSTFMVEMVETAQILHQATPESLVILDEVGRGTSTFDGMAIARAVVEYLHNRADVAPKTLFATHYHELTALAGVLPRVRNFHVEVQESGREVTFTHNIAPGPSDRSYGIHVARLAGLPGAVVSRAEHVLAELESSREATPARHANGHRPAQPSLFTRESDIEAALRDLDVESMTPIEAIQRLYELRAAARDQVAGG